MAEQQETTFPSLTPRDFQDPTMFRVNTMMKDIYEKLSSAQAKATNVTNTHTSQSSLSYFSSSGGLANDASEVQIEYA